MAHASHVVRSGRIGLAATLVAAFSLAGCTNPVGADISGWHYARLRGTVARQNGTPVANAQIGISCVGATAEPFGYTADADGTGRFDTELNAADLFAPLEGSTYVCRVLTPYVGVPQAEKSLTVQFGTSKSARPVTEVSLVVP